MSSVRALALLFVLLWGTTKGQNVQVSCVFMESCVLPCSFQSGPDPVIHWLKTPGEVPVHSYYHSQDQLSLQQQDFKERTSLSEDQISRGNASLLLRDVKVQDEGTYKCYTSTADSDSKNSFIDLRVRGSVSFVSLEQREDELICSSKNIYLKPAVTWSGPDGTEAKTSVSETQKGLYSIFSSVTLLHSPPEEHSCNISTGPSWKSATYRLQLRKIILGNEVTVRCPASKAPIKSLTWKFNHIQTILTRTGTNTVYNEAWRQFVEEVSESGRLTLKDLSSDHQGVYSCVLSSDGETHISSTDIREETIIKDLSSPWLTAVLLVLGVLFFILFIIGLILFLYQKHRKVPEEQVVLKQECESLRARRLELLSEILAYVGLYLDGTLQVEESEETHPLINSRKAAGL